MARSNRSRWVSNALFLMVLGLIFSGCLSETVLVTDDEMDNFEMIELMGGTTGEGNPASIEVGFVSVEPPSSVQVIARWKKVTFDINQVFLPAAFECDTLNGDVLEAQRGSIEIPFISRGGPRLKLLAPSQTPYCGIDFVLPESSDKQAPFHAKGFSLAGQPVEVKVDLYQRLRFLARNDFFNWMPGQKLNWLVVLDLAELLPQSLIDLIVPDDDGVRRVDATHNTDLIVAVNRAIISAFSLINDRNGNGKLDEGEFTNENRVGRSDYDNEPESDCPILEIYCDDHYFPCRQLDFGRVGDEEILDLMVDVGNNIQAARNLTVHEIVINNPQDLDFLRIREMLPLPQYLVPSEAMSFSVELGSGLCQEGEASLTILTDDCLTPLINIPITWSCSHTPTCDNYSIQPETLDFGTVPKGDKKILPLKLMAEENNSAGITIIDATVEGQWVFSIEEEFPLTLRRGSSLTLNIAFEPASSDPTNGRLLIASDACDQEIMIVDLFGNEISPQHCLDIEPDAHDFGTLQYGALPSNQVFCVKNGCSIPVDLTSVALENGEHFTFGNFGGEIPVGGSSKRLESNEQYCFAVQYEPQAPSNAEDHTDHVRITSNSPYAFEQSMSIALTGRTENVLLSVWPNPLDFGTASVDDGVCTNNSDCRAGYVCHNEGCARMLEALIYNWSEERVLIKDLDISDLGSSADCSEFSIDSTSLEQVAARICTQDSDCLFGMVCDEVEGVENRYCQILPGASTPAPVILYYQPEDSGFDVDCSLRLRHNLPGINEFLPFDMIAEGALTNQAPVARASLQDHGSPITTAIENVNIDTRLCFYGSISYDPDGTITAYDWSLPTIPPGSAGNIVLRSEAGIPGVNCCIDFDAPGDYVLRLMVKDDQNTWSNPLDITIAVGDDDDWLTIRLTIEDIGGEFLGTNQIDVDLKVEDPIGIVCYDERLNSNNTCSFAPGNGIAIMSQWIGEDGTNSTVEEMRLVYPVDGAWTFSASYANDCSDWYDFLVVPFCGATERNLDYTLEFINPNTGDEYFPAVNGTLKEAGDMNSYRIIRQDGLWSPPQPL